MLQFLLIINETMKQTLIYFVKYLEGYMSNYEEKKAKHNLISWDLIAYVLYNISSIL